MRRKIAIRGGVAFLALVIGFSLGYLARWGTTRDRESDAIQRVVAMSWGDGKYGKAFYGVEVYVLSAKGGYAVHARVWIGHGNGMWDDLGELGVVGSPEEAVEKWGHVEWSASGLTIGPGDPDPFFVPRARLESHR